MNLNAFKISENITAREIRTFALVLIIYAVGIAGMSFQVTTGLFIKLIPLVLVLSLAASLFFHNEYNFKTVAVFTLIVVLSWMVEAAGVATGAIFGYYAYGPALGLKIFATPVIIGFNWLLLVYGSACLAGSFNFNRVLKVLSASALMVIYDFALEIAAPHLGMWEFDGVSAPARNFIAWFLFAVLFHSLVEVSGIRTSNRVAAVVFVVQFIFFLALALIFKL